MGVAGSAFTQLASRQGLNFGKPATAMQLVQSPQCWPTASPSMAAASEWVRGGSVLRTGWCIEQVHAQRAV